MVESGVVGDKNGPRATRLLHLFSDTVKCGREGFDFRHFISERVTMYLQSLFVILLPAAIVSIKASHQDACVSFNACLLYTSDAADE